LFGAAEVNQYEIAEILSRELGRKITYTPVTIEAFAQVMKPIFSPYFIQHISSVAQDCLDGLFSGMNDSVEKISGTKPLYMTDYIRKNIALFK